MVNELRELLRDNVASPPPDHADLVSVLASGRRRVRRRHRMVAGGVALATAAVVSVGSWTWLHPSPPDLGTAGVPVPPGEVLRLADAEPAVEGRDYDVLTTYTNEDLDADNGEYLDGVTDDGLVLFREGQTMTRRQERYALMDPATGGKDWLPDPPLRGEQLWPVDLGADVLLWSRTVYDPDADFSNGEPRGDLEVIAFDRRSRTWSTTSWPKLPPVDFPQVHLGPDGRLYVLAPATQGGVPEGGWPMGADGEADDADAPGDTFAVWSVSPTDPGDARDERLRVGSLAFTDSSMVWTDSSNGDSGMVHVRDLSTDEETSFDPEPGERCNLLSFGATDERIVMGQYCGTYEDGVRDDRVQVLTTAGEQVTTIQDSDLEGGLAGGGEPGLVTVRSHQRGSEGTYVYDLADGRFLRVSDSVSMWALGGTTTRDGVLMWDTATNRHRGATQVVAEWRD